MGIVNVPMWQTGRRKDRVYSQSYQAGRQLDLELQKLEDGGLAVNPKRAQERVEVNRRRKRVRNAKGHHQPDLTPCVLESPGMVGDAVLLRLALREDVHLARLVDRPLVLPGAVGPLLPLQNREVVGRHEPAGVTLGAHGGAKDDQILGERGM